MRLRNESYEPPYDAFTSVYSDKQTHVCMAMIGVQALSEVSAEPFIKDVDSLFEKPGSGFQHFERIREVDKTGAVNHVFVSYWSSQELMAEWLESERVKGWLTQALNGPVGVWIEAFQTPVDQIDPNYSQQDIQWGSGRYTQQKWERYHSYFGSMRDRIPKGHSGEIDPSPRQIKPVKNTDPRGRILYLSDPPHHLCFIRGAFGWKQATPVEQQAFLEEMFPVYRTGALYLRDDPIGANCISSRFGETIRGGPETGVQHETLAWFLSLKDLERWAHSHPTHLAIFKGTFDYMQKFSFNPKLLLGHEVFVVPSQGMLVAYNNCHAGTGFIPFFEMEAVETAKEPGA